MAYQEVTNLSWWDRIKNAFAGIVVGLVFIVGVTVLLFWNEGRTVRTTQGIGEVREKCESLPDVTTVHSEFDGKPVYAYGKVETTATLTDPTFDLSLEGVLRLRRKTEFYQWVEESRTETRKKLGGGEEQVTTYTYEQKWVDAPVDSNHFKEAGHTNTVIASLGEMEEQVASPVTLEAYTLPEFLVRELDDFQTVTLDPISPEQIQTIGGRLTWNRPLTTVPVTVTDASNAASMVSIPETATGSQENPDVSTAIASGTVITQETVDNVSTTTESPTDSTVTPISQTAVPQITTQMVYPISMAQNTFYLGTPTAPQNGDIRIHFEQVNSTNVSLIARQVRDTFEPYHTQSNIDFSAIESGTLSQDRLLDNAESGNQMMAWLLRLGGWIGVSIGITMVLRPLSVLADVVPFIGSIVGAGSAIIAWLIGSIWTLLVIMVAWLFYRPYAAGILLVVIVVLMVALRRLTASKKTVT